MAALLGSVQISEQAIASGTAETLLQLITPANHRAKLVRWGVFFDGTSVTGEPVQIRLLRQSSSGTASTLAPVKLDPSISETLQVAAQGSFSAEPSAGDILESYEVHPQQGIMVLYPLGQEIIIGGAGRLGIETTSTAAVNARAFAVFEE